MTKLRELIEDDISTIPPPFQYEPGIVDIDDNTDPYPTNTKSQEQYNIWKMQEIRISIKCQGDTGANVGVTHDKQILWNYRILATPIPIITYSKDEGEGNTCEVVGVGQCKTISNNNTVMYWTMLHTPELTGTILSPDKYMMDNSAIQTFSHVGNKNGTSSITFENKNGQVIASIEMARHQGGLLPISTRQQCQKHSHYKAVTQHWDS